MSKIDKRLVEEVLNTKRVNLKEFVEKYNLDINGTNSIIEELKSKGIINVEEKIKSELRLTDEGKKTLKEGFSEITLLNKSKISDLNDREKHIGLGWAKRKGMIEIKNGAIILTDIGRKYLSKYPLYEDLKNHKENPELIKRNLLIKKDIKDIIITSTDLTEAYLNELIESDSSPTVGELTKEIIVNQSWKNKRFKRYDVQVPGEKPLIGERHVVNRFMNRVRRIFVEMGFEEIEGPLVESSFWNFDALFQPQDHPARELADTFYVKKPYRFELPDKNLVNKVSSTHEKKWKYNWDQDEAKRVVLRTHTTALSARKLSTLKDSNGKFFAIGRVFRNEAIDYKHLAEFHQIEGIVVWDKANLRHLLWILKEFYRKLGFDKIKFKPSFFPYTEPSIEIHAYFKEKKSWIELGGAGIFRREVSIPLFGRYPVLAWGLSVERPLMMELELKDIRTFYRNNLRELDDISKRGLKWLL